MAWLDHNNQGESPDPAKAQTSRPGILVADDEETIRFVVQQILERHGYTIFLAGNGKEAVELFERHHEVLAAVLLDLTMPVLSGEEAFHRMRQINSDVSIILFSGYSEQDTLSRVNGRGVAGFLQKPFRPKELLDCINAVVNSSS